MYFSSRGRSISQTKPMILTDIYAVLRRLAIVPMLPFLDFIKQIAESRCRQFSFQLAGTLSAMADIQLLSPTPVRQTAESKIPAPDPVADFHSIGNFPALFPQTVNDTSIL